MAAEVAFSVRVCLCAAANTARINRRPSPCPCACGATITIPMAATFFPMGHHIAVPASLPTASGAQSPSPTERDGSPISGPVRPADRDRQRVRGVNVVLRQWAHPDLLDLCGGQSVPGAHRKTRCEICRRADAGDSLSARRRSLEWSDRNASHRSQVFCCWVMDPGDSLFGRCAEVWHKLPEPSSRLRPRGADVAFELGSLRPVPRRRGRAQLWGKRANAVDLLEVTHVSSLAGPRARMTQLSFKCRTSHLCCEAHPQRNLLRLRHH